MDPVTSSSSCRTDGALPARVDAVITWVDGSDPAHRDARNQALRSISPFDVTTIRAGIEETRFSDNGELLYCIRCIRAFLPWMHTIHLVTASQRPSYLTDSDLAQFGVRLVDHADLFRGYEWALPTFNSQTIETMLHRIDGLAEHFVYFNDDVLAIQPLKVADFFCGGGIIARGRWCRARSWNVPATLLAGLAARVATVAWRRRPSLHAVPQVRAAKMAGFDGRYLHADHAPYAARRTTLQRYFAQEPVALERNIRFRFRNLLQFNAMPLATHLEWQSGSCRVDEQPSVTSLNFGKDDQIVLDEKIGKLRAAPCAFLCLQDFELAAPEQRSAVVEFLEERLDTQANAGSLPQS